MEKLTRLIIICFASLIVSSFKKDNNNNKDELTISAQFVDLNSLSIKTVLYNNGNDTIILKSGCSYWESFYRTDNKDLLIRSALCFYKNQALVIIIPPHKTFERTLQLMNTKRTYNVPFKIGFNYLKQSRYVRSNLQLEKLELSENIIWSNSLIL